MRPNERKPGELDNLQKERRHYRYYLQAAARDLLSGVMVPRKTGHKRQGAKTEVELGVVWCLRAPNKEKDPITGTFGEARFIGIRRSPSARDARFTDLARCNSPHSCPPCAAILSAQRTEDLRRIVAAAKAQGKGVALLTYTLRHTRRDDPKDVLNALIEARREFKAGGWFKRFKADHGWFTSVKSIETTFGKNGPHPHAHELIIFDHELSEAELGEIQSKARTRWMHVLKGQGRSADWSIGLDIKTGDTAVGDYIAKTDKSEMEWGVENEISSTPLKTAHRDGLTPLQLLEASTFESDNPFFVKYGYIVRSPRQAGELWKQYALAMHGVHWIDGLTESARKLGVDLNAGAGDEWIADDEYDLAKLTRSEWNKLLDIKNPPQTAQGSSRREIRGVVMKVAGEGGAAALRRFLALYGINPIIFPDDTESLPALAVVPKPSQPSQPTPSNAVVFEPLILQKIRRRMSERGTLK